MRTAHPGGHALAQQAPTVREKGSPPTVQIPQCVLAAAIVSAERALTSCWPEEHRDALSRLIEELGEWAEGSECSP